MRLMKFVFSSVVLAIVAIQGLACSADVIKYSGNPDPIKSVLGTPASNVTPIHDAFLNSLSSYGVNDLEAIAAGPNPVITFGGTGITGTTNFPGGVNAFTLLAVSGNNFLLDVEGANSTPFNDSITFSRTITAFGTYITNAGDGNANNFSVLLENTVAGTSKTIDFGTLGPDAPQTNVRFFGFTDTAGFDRISFIESNDFDGMLYDDIIAGDVAAVPEPASIAVVAAGIAGIMRFRRKKKLAA